MDMIKFCRKIVSVICAISGVLSFDLIYAVNEKILKLNYKFGYEPFDGNDVANEISNWEQKFKKISKKVKGSCDNFPGYEYNLGKRLFIHHDGTYGNIYLAVDIDGNGNWIRSTEFPFCFFVSVARIDGMKCHDFSVYESSSSEFKKKILRVFSDMCGGAAGNVFTDFYPESAEDLADYIVSRLSDSNYFKKKYNDVTTKNVKKIKSDDNIKSRFDNLCYRSFFDVVERYSNVNPDVGEQNIKKEIVKTSSGFSLRQLLLYLSIAGISTGVVGYFAGFKARNNKSSKKKKMLFYNRNRKFNHIGINKKKGYKSVGPNLKIKRRI